MSSDENRANNNEPKTPWYQNIINTIKEAPTNFTLLCVSAFVYYKMKTAAGRQNQENPRVNPLAIAEADIDYIDEQIQAHRYSPSLHFKDYTLRQLFEHNGTREGERILIAVNNNIYDVTYAKHFYGPNGIHHHLAGREISRTLLNLPTDDPFKYDDLSSLTEEQRETLRDWAMQHMERYSCIGCVVPTFEEDPNCYYEDDYEFFRRQD